MVAADLIKKQANWTIVMKKRAIAVFFILLHRSIQRLRDRILKLARFLLLQG